PGRQRRRQPVSEVRRIRRSFCEPFGRQYHVVGSRCRPLRADGQESRSPGIPRPEPAERRRDRALLSRRPHGFARGSRRDHGPKPARPRDRQPRRQAHRRVSRHADRGISRPFACGWRRRKRPMRAARGNSVPGSLVPVIGGPALILTWFLLQGSAPDAPHRERTEALQMVLFHNAALQRDVLQARAGLLRNYDPLVNSMQRLVSATADLQSAGEVASGEVQRDIERRSRSLAAAIREQEALVERFKSDNALLENSLAYFNT